MPHATSDGRTIHLVHTWRDGSYFYDGEYGYDSERIGAEAVGEEKNLQKVVEIRHLKGQGVETRGELFQWEKDENMGWMSTHFGEYSERILVENDFII